MIDNSKKGNRWFELRGLGLFVPDWMDIDRALACWFAVYRRVLRR